MITSRAAMQLSSGFRSWYVIVLSILFSGCCYYLGNGLTGDSWLLVWLAPAPLICVAVANPARVAFAAAFIAYGLGRLSWFSYLVRVAFLVPAILFTIAPALIFAGIILLTRYVAIRCHKWYAFLAFPALFCVFEYLLIEFAPDGSAGSIAYSQMNCLPLIQIAAVSGILGITFVVTLIPSALGFIFILKDSRPQLIRLLLGAGMMILVVFAFGWVRLREALPAGKLKVAMVVMPEAMHNTSDRPNPVKDSAATRFYLRQIDSLAGKGVAAVLLPERALSIDPRSGGATVQALRASARSHGVYIVAGYTNIGPRVERNAALVIDDAGNIAAGYNKVHLVNGLERQFAPGDTIGLFSLHQLPAGIAICKDLDFQDYIRGYGQQQPALLFIPAWDFIVDDWLHARMAVLRGVENGFTEVRAARSGRLSISDPYGRITAETSSADQQAAALVGVAPLQHKATLYTHYGNWMGIATALLSAGLLLLAWRRRSAL